MRPQIPNSIAPILMAQLSIPRLSQQLTMSEDSDQDFEPPNSLNQWRADPPVAINFNPFAPSSSSSSTIATAPDPLTFDSDWFSDAGSESDHDVRFFVTDLFEDLHCPERFRVFDCDGPGLRSASDPSSEPVNELGIWGFEDEGEIGLNYVEELGFNIGVEPGSPISDGELDVQVVDSRISGLRVVGVDSESESESDADEVIDGVFELNSGYNGENDISWVENPNNPWDNFGLQEQRTVYEDFEWEEVEERMGERENLNVVADGVEELSVASGFSSEQERPLEAVRTLEWEILLAVNNLGRNPNLESEIDEEYFLAVQDDYTNTAEYDTLFGQFVENENALKGSPPAAKSVVENLPLVELKLEDLKGDNLLCAVCKDEMPLEEKVKKLPCCHYYHEDCILPWLNIRNTCPACRYELPTDDPDYERRKAQRVRNGSESNLEVRYNFEMIA